MRSVIATDTVEGFQQSLKEKSKRVANKNANLHTVGHQLRGAHATSHFIKGVPILKSPSKSE
jgi:uncharacterized protein with GYD domain